MLPIPFPEEKDTGKHHFVYPGTISVHALSCTASFPLQSDPIWTAICTRLQSPVRIRSRIRGEILHTSVIGGISHHPV